MRRRRISGQSVTRRKIRVSFGAIYSMGNAAQTLIVEDTAQVKNDAWPKGHPKLSLRRRAVTWIVFACILSIFDLLASSSANASRGVDPTLMSPPLTNGQPVTVKVGLFLTNLIDVDEVKERFQISGYLFMTWKDPRLAFGPDQTLEQRTYNPDEIWTPRLFLINQTSKRERVSTNIRGEPDGTLHYVELFQDELTSSFPLETFPFDRQSLEIFLQPFLDERDTMTIMYDPHLSGVGTEPFVELAQWQILGLNGSQRRSAIGRTNKQISELEIDLLVKRRYRYYLWKVFLPLLLMVGIAYSAFWIKIDDYYTQISITLTAILTEIAFLFAISNSLPKVPYLTFIDAFFLMSFLFSCLCMAELVAVHQFREWDQSEHGEGLRRVSQLLYPAIYIAIVAVVTLIFFGLPAFR